MGQENTASTSTASLESALAAWRAQVEKDLKGADFNKRLVTRTPEGIALQPLYTRADMPASVSPAEKPGEAPFRRGWVKQPVCRRLQAIKRPDAASYNKALREALMNGQDAVMLPAIDSTAAAWKPTQLDELVAALDGVEIGAVPVYLPAQADPLPAAALYLAHAKQRNVATETLTGGVTADPIGTSARVGQAPADDQSLIDNLAGWTGWCATHAPGVRTVAVDASVYHTAGAHAGQELGFALATLAEYLREFEQRGMVALTVLKHTLVTFGIGPKFFTELAKFRAWRVLVSKLLVAMGVDPAAATGMAVHAKVGAWNQTQLDAHANMLRSTTAALSGVLGGVDGLQIPSFDEALEGDSIMGERIARNLHAVIGEEFGFGNPQDAGGGSWYIEKHSDELARGAWSVFREVEKRGGLRAALKADWPQSEIQAVVANRTTDHAIRRSGLVGTNVFPNLQDKLPTAAAKPDGEASHGLDAVGARAWPDCLSAASAAVRDGVAVTAAAPAPDAPVALATFAPLVPYRAAAVFEDLRRRAQAIATQRGHAPSALLLKMGPVKQHKPRADFSAEFVAVGGFVPATKETFATASDASMAAVEGDADIAVICSTDDTYPELVPEIARAIKAAKPGMSIVLAGMPRDEAVVQCFRDAGVDEFIHVRANVPDVLGRLLTAIEA